MYPTLAYDTKPNDSRTTIVIKRLQDATCSWTGGEEDSISINWEITADWIGYFVDKETVFGYDNKYF